MKSLFNFLSFKVFAFALCLFVVLLFWRIILIVVPGFNTDINVQIWAATYQIVAWYGAIVGIIFSNKWGGVKSLLGRSSLAFSLGLLAQSFGQSVFSWYFYTGNVLPYPSIADIGFFGSIPFYIYGVVALAKVAGSHFSLRSSVNQAKAVLIPVVILGASYLVFLKDYQFDSTQPILRAVLDFGYPLGQAIYISIAIIAYVLSKNILGGIMKKPVVFFIIALCTQYVADYTFLYQSMHGTFVGGGIVDCLYLIAYFLMALSLIQLGFSFQEIRKS